MSEQRPLPNGWRLSLPYEQSRETAHVKRMVDELKAIPRQKIPPTTTQAPSTQALLDAQKARPEWEDAKYIREKWAKDFPEHTQVRNPDGSIDVGERPVSINEALLVENTRRAQKNTIGQSTESSVSGEKRQRGIEAFTYSEPANLSNAELERLAKLNEMEAVVAAEPPKQSEPKEYSWWTRLRWQLFAYPGESLESFGGRK